MSQVNKLKKLQQGGTTPKTYQVKANGELVTISETELNNYYRDYVGSLGAKSKNTQDWNESFNKLKSNIEAGQKSGNYFDFSVSDSDASNINASSTLSIEDKGFNKRGNVAKPGFLAGLKGVKNEAARSSTLNYGLGTWVADALTNKRKKDEEERLRLEREKQEGVDLENSKLDEFYKGSFRNLDMGLSLFGPQASPNDDQLRNTNYNRYWEEGADQNNIHRGYLERLRGTFSDSRYDDEKYDKIFSQANPLGWQKFKENLNNLDLNNIQDYQSAYDNLGLGAQYKLLNTREQAPTADPNAANLNADGSLKNGLIDGVLWVDGYRYTGDYQGDFYKDGVLGEGEHNDIFYRKGKPFTGEDNETFYDGGTRKTDFSNIQDIDTAPVWGYKDIFADGKKLRAGDYFTESAERNDIFREGLKTLISSLDQHNKMYDQSLSQIWKERNINKDPYGGVKPKDVLGATEIQSNFSETGANADGKYDTALILEKTNNLDPLTRRNNYQYRMIRKNPNSGQREEMVGIIKRDPLIDSYYFHSSDGTSIFLGTYNENEPPSELHKRNADKIYTFTKTSKQAKPNSFIQLNRPSGLKQGGVLKFQQGSKFSQYGEFGNSVAPIRGTQHDLNSGKEYKASTVLGDSDYQMTSADYTQLAALSADLAGLGFAFVPGANVASAATGAVGSIANASAEYQKTGDAWGAGKQLAGNLVLDAVTLAPILGGAAKSAKLLNGVKRMAPVLRKALTAAQVAGGSVGLANAAGSLEKIVKGEATIEDLRILASGLTSAVYAKNAFDSTRALKTTGFKTKAMINGKPEEISLDESQFKQLNAMTKESDKIKFIQNLAVRNNLASKPEEVDLGVVQGNFGLNPTKWKIPKGLQLEPQKGIKSASETNWFTERAAKRYAANNPNVQGADRFVGGFTTKGTTLDRTSPKWNQPKMKITSGVPLKSPWSLNYQNNMKSGLSRDEALTVAKKAGFHERSLLPMALQSKWTPPVTNSVKRPEFDSKTPIIQNTPTNNIPSSGNVIVLSHTPRDPGIASNLKTGEITNNFIGMQPNNMEAVPFRMVGNTGAGTNRKDTYEYIIGGKRAGSLAQNQLTEIRKKLFGGKQGEVSLKSIMKPDGSFTYKDEKFFDKLDSKFKESSLVKKSVENILTKSFDNYLKNKKNFNIKFQKGGKVVKLQNGNRVPLVPIDMSKFERPALPEFNTFHNNFNKISKAGLSKPTARDNLGQSDPGSSGKFSMNYDPFNVSEFIRMGINIMGNNSGDRKIPATMQSNPTEVYNSVKGDGLVRQAYDDNANKLMNIASQPFTSDASLHNASMLSASGKAADIKLQGAMVNSQARMQQEMNNTELARNYALQRNETANNNQSTLKQRDYAQTQLENQRKLGNFESINNFLGGVNQRNMMERERMRPYHQELNTLNSQNTKFASSHANKDWADKTPSQIRQSYLTEMNQILAIDEGLRTPDQKRRLQNLSEMYDNLMLDSKRNALHSMINSSAPGTKTIGFGGYKQPSYGNILMNRSGGRLTKEERKELISYSNKLRVENQWVRDYNNWLKLKMNNDAKKNISREKGINDIVKMSLSKK